MARQDTGILEAGSDLSEQQQPRQDVRPSPHRLSLLERRIAALENEIAILSRAIGLASLREVDLLRQLGLSTQTLCRDADELRSLIGFPED